MARSQEQQLTTVDVPWIKAHVADPGVRLVEVDVSLAAYDEGHIPGAIIWNAYTDLRDSSYRPVSPAELQRLLSRSGIDPDTTVVVYGYAAALGFWLMKAHGHEDVRMLAGRRDQWVEAGGEWTTEVPQPEESRYPLPASDADILASRQAVEAAIGEPSRVIL